MQWLVMVLPSFVSVTLSERLERKSYRGVEFVKCLGLYMLFSNLATILVFQYILKLPTSILTSFENNLFLIHYVILSLFFSILLPIAKLAVHPHIHISVTRRGKEDGEDAGGSGQDDEGAA